MGNLPEYSYLEFWGSSYSQYTIDSSIHIIDNMRSSA